MEALIGLALSAALFFAFIYGLAFFFFRGRQGSAPLPRPYVLVHEWERGLVYRGGRFRRVAQPGKVWTF